MDLSTLLSRPQRILNEGSIYELLRRSPAVEFDPFIAHAGLIYEQPAAAVLEGVFRSYFDIAKDHGLPMLSTTATWRANRERIAQSRFSERAVNEDNVRFVCAIRESYGAANPGILIGAGIGPKGDAYKPEQALSPRQAYDFHSYQLQALAGAGADFLQASTLPALSEAIGIAQSMATFSMPYIISFVIDRTGTLLDGIPLADAIHSIDDAVSTLPTGYAVNCVHPSVLLSALDANSGIDGRIIMFNGNTSSRSAAELDGLEILDTQAPEDFTAAISELTHKYAIPIIGGCCGTDPSHIACIAERL